jgi:hypothetical protein
MDRTPSYDVSPTLTVEDLEALGLTKNYPGLPAMREATQEALASHGEFAWAIALCLGAATKKMEEDAIAASQDLLQHTVPEEVQRAHPESYRRLLTVREMQKQLTEAGFQDVPTVDLCHLTPACVQALCTYKTSLSIFLCETAEQIKRLEGQARAAIEGNETAMSLLEDMLPESIGGAFGVPCALPRRKPANPPA